MRATAEPVEGNVVRLSVEVEEPEVERLLDKTVRTLSRQARIPGFRPGKVPRQVLEARMGGAGALRAEALKEGLPDFYARAVQDAEVDPIAPPEIDITAGEEGGAVAFDAVVQVRPSVAIPGYEGLQVTVPSLVVTDEEVEAQVLRLRENEGELVVAGRPAVDGDHVTINIHGTSRGEEVLGADDYLYEVGSASVVPELDAELRGATPGSVLTFAATPPDADETVVFRVLVKEVQRKQLPEATDEWAAESSEFETLDALRDDIRARLSRVKVMQSQLALRENALNALIELVDDAEVPEVMVEEEVQQRVHDLSHRLEQQRVTLDQLLAATGRSGEELLAEVRAEAFKTVKGDLALRATADAQELTVTDEELDAEVAAMAQRMEMDPSALRAQLDRGGRTTAVRSEQRKVKALTWLLDHVELVDDDGHPVSRDDLRVDQGTEEAESDDTGGDGVPESDEATGEIASGATADTTTEEVER